MTRRLLLVMALAALSAAGQDKKPTPVRAIEEWLAAFNSGKPEEMTRFHKNWGMFEDPAEEKEKTEQIAGFFKQTGGFTLEKITRQSATEAAADLAEKKGDSKAEIEVEVEQGATPRIVNIGLRPKRAAASGPPPVRWTDSEVANAIRQHVDELAATGKFSGAVSVTRHGKPVLESAWGLADREQNIANQVDTKFNLGSMNKMFTAVSICQLAQAGKLKFDDPIGKYLANYPNREAAEKVTIHHLLTHTGGMGDIFGPDFDKNLEKLKTLQDYVDLYGSRAPQFAPGSSWRYSNYGFLLLGRIVEAVSGKDYYSYVAENVFKPAGMKDSASYWRNEKVANLALGYRNQGGQLNLNFDTLPVRGTSAGGGYSTVKDLQKFAVALLSNRLLDAEHTRLVTTGKVEARFPGAKYAYGFIDSAGTSPRWFGHGGGAPGINSELRIFPGPGYVVAIGTNTEPGGASPLADWIGARLPAEPGS